MINQMAEWNKEGQINYKERRNPTKINVDIK